MPTTSNQVVLDFANSEQAEALWEWFVVQGASETFLEGEWFGQADCKIPKSCTSETKPGFPNGNDYYHISFK